MPGVSKRGNKYRYWYTDEAGKVRWGTGTADRRRTLDLAIRLEHQARLVKEGLVEPEAKRRREAAAARLGDLIDLWRAWLSGQGVTRRHARHQTGACRRLLEGAGATSILDVDSSRVIAAMADLASRRSARTANHALRSVKAFYRWLEDTERVSKPPKWLRAIRPLNEEVDRRRVRRELTDDEIEQILAAAEAGPEIYLYGPTKSKHHKIAVTGPARALIYRLALGTGFRAEELRSLKPESFRLDGPAPTVTITAAYAKGRRTSIQPISLDLASRVRTWLAADPLPVVPTRTAEMLALDLSAAGVPVETPDGVVDFHALRHTYISRIARSGASVKVTQELARHTTPSLTFRRYVHVDDAEKRRSVEGSRVKGQKAEVEGGGES